MGLVTHAVQEFRDRATHYEQRVIDLLRRETGKTDPFADRLARPRPAARTAAAHLDDDKDTTR